MYGNGLTAGIVFISTRMLQCICNNSKHTYLIAISIIPTSNCFLCLTTSFNSSTLSILVGQIFSYSRLRIALQTSLSKTAAHLPDSQPYHTSARTATNLLSLHNQQDVKTGSPLRASSKGCCEQAAMSLSTLMLQPVLVLHTTQYLPVMDDACAIGWNVLDCFICRNDRAYPATAFRG